MPTLIRCTVLVSVASLIAGCSKPQVRATREFAFERDWQTTATLVVDTRNGGIDVLCGSGEQLSVSGVIHAYGENEADAEQRLTTLDVVAERDTAGDAYRVFLKHPEGYSPYSFGARVTVRVPAECAVHADTSNGAVRLENVTAAQVNTSNGGILLANVKGDASADTSNGAIDARGVGGKLTGSSSNGSLTLRSITGGVQLSTSNGEIQAEEIGGHTELRTSNGSVRVDLAAARCDGVSIETSNGRVEVVVPAAFGANLDLSASNGKVYRGTCGERITVTSSTKNSLIGKLNGGGVPIDCATSNGTVTITCR